MRMDRCSMKVEISFPITRSQEVKSEQEDLVMGKQCKAAWLSLIFTAWTVV